jgi:hypothetical protein
MSKKYNDEMIMIRLPSEMFLEWMEKLAKYEDLKNDN